MEHGEGERTLRRRCEAGHAHAALHVGRGGLLRGERIARKGQGHVARARHASSGVATFGVLPDVSKVLPRVAFAHADEHRFGGQGTAYLKPGEACCSGDGYRPLYPDLGLTWVNDNRNWSVTEDKAPNLFDPTADNLAPFFKHGDLLRLIQLDGIPAWASPTKEATHNTRPHRSMRIATT